MTRNACLNHPKDRVIEIPAGYKYCERCKHLVPPEMEIVEIIEEVVQKDEQEAEFTEKDNSIETPVEAEPELVIDPIPLHTGSANTSSQEFTEQPLEPETVEETESLPEMIKEVLEAETEVKESLEESPEETAPAEVVEPTEEEAVVPEPEVVAEVIKEPLETKSTDLGKDNEMAILRAKLRELE